MLEIGSGQHEQTVLSEVMVKNVDEDESNANFSDNEARADPVIASSPAFSNAEFRLKYMQKLLSGTASLADSNSMTEQMMHSHGHLRQPSC